MNFIFAQTAVKIEWTSTPADFVNSSFLFMTAYLSGVQTTAFYYDSTEECFHQTEGKKKKKLSSGPLPWKLDERNKSTTHGGDIVYHMSELERYSRSELKETWYW